MITKKAITIEIIGESSSGKTDLVSRFPNVTLCDLTPSQESDVIFLKYHDEKYFDEHYFPCQTFNDILHTIRDMPDDTKIFVIDGSQYITDFAESQWIKDQQKHREAALQREYGILYSMVRDQIIYPLIKKPCNVVFTSILKDVWLNDKRTGQRERSGFKPFDVMRDVGLYLYIEENNRKNKIVKNRFVSPIITVDGLQTDNPNYIKELKPEANWNTLIDAICVPGSAMRREWVV